MQNRSRLIVGTSGMGKTTDIEREAFIAARHGRKFFLIDGKGTDPGFVERALAGYLWGNPHARIALWPELPMDGWRGNPRRPPQPAHGHARLDRALLPGRGLLLLRLALNAPREDGPVRSSSQLMARMDPSCWSASTSTTPTAAAKPTPSSAGTRPGRSRAPSGGSPTSSPPPPAASTPAPRLELRGRRLRLPPGPYLAGRQDADACMRLLLEDFAHYATLRKPRKGEDATLVFDEFSAIAGGREAAIQLVERVRDAGCALYLSAQSADGLGDGPSSAAWSGLLGRPAAHAVPDPDTLLRAAGVVKVVEQTWRLDSGPTGNSSARIGERPGSSPPRAAGPRRRSLVHRPGRFEHLMVARTTISDGYRARAHAMVALARSWRPTEVLPGARTWVEASQAGQEALSGLRGHLAMPPADADGDDLGHLRRPSRPGRRRPGTGCGWPWPRPPATATRTPPPPWSAKPRPTAWTWPSWWRWPRLLAQAPAHRRAWRAGRRWAAAGCGGCTASRPGGSGRTGAPAMTGALDLAARNRPPRFAAVRGPRPLRGPARPGRLPAGRAATSDPPRSRRICSARSASATHR